MRLPLGPARSIAPVTAAVALLGCSESPRASSFVGLSADSDVVFAAVEEDGAVRAYTCGGPATYDSRSRWFEGDLDASGALSIAKQGWTLQGSLEGSSPKVELTPPSGEPVSFAVRPADGALEGLYDAVDSGCRTGAIVWVEGGATRLQGTWCDDADHFAQVTPVTPIEARDQGIAVRVDLSSLGLGTRDLVVKRTEAP